MWYHAWPHWSLKRFYQIILWIQSRTLYFITLSVMFEYCFLLYYFSVLHVTECHCSQHLTTSPFLTSLLSRQYILDITLFDIRNLLFYSFHQLCSSTLLKAYAYTTVSGNTDYSFVWQTVVSNYCYLSFLSCCLWWTNMKGKHSLRIMYHTIWYYVWAIQLVVQQYITGNMATSVEDIFEVSQLSCILIFTI